MEQNFLTRVSEATSLSSMTVDGDLPLSSHGGRPNNYVLTQDGLVIMLAGRPATPQHVVRVLTLLAEVALAVLQKSLAETRPAACATDNIEPVRTKSERETDFPKFTDDTTELAESSSVIIRDKTDNPQWLPFRYYTG
jgi:hypothetical protein